MIKYQFDEQQLNSYAGLKRFLSATSPADFIQFEAEAREKRSYSKLVTSGLIEEKSLSALSLCALLGKNDHIEYLLSLNCLAPESDDALALKLACINGDLSIVNRFLAFQNVLKKLTVDRNYVLRVAILTDNIELVHRLLQFQDIQNDIAIDQNRMLKLAAQVGNPQMLEILLIFPEVQEMVAINENEALCLATENGFPLIVKRLLTFSAVKRKVAVLFTKSLDTAIIRGHVDVVCLILGLDEARLDVIRNGEHLLALAAQSNALPIVERLLDIPEIRQTLAKPNHRALALAIKNGHSDIVRLFLQYPEIQANLTHIGNDAVYIAATEGHTDCLNLLLTMPGTDAHLAINDNDTLRIAAKKGVPKIIERLLQNNNVWRGADAFDNEALRTATLHGNFMASRLLLNIPHVRAKATAKRNAPLFSAASTGLTSIVSDLLTIRAVYENAAIDNNKPIACAAANGHIDIVHLFLDIPFVKESCNNHTLQNAAINGHRRIVEELARIPGVWNTMALNNNAIFRDVIRNNHTDVALFMLSNPYVRQQAEAGNNSALCHAIRHGSLTLVSELMQIAGVKANLAANRNRALYLACKYGHLPIVEMLLDDPNVLEHISGQGNIALYVAARRGHIDVVKKLLEHQRVRERIAASGNSVFRAAVAEGHTAIARHLLQHPAVQHDINAYNFEALRIVAQNGDLNTLNVLLPCADVANNTPALIHHVLCVACQHGQDEIVQRILQLENVCSNAHAFDNQAFLLAVAHGQLNIVRQLLALAPIRQQLGLNNSALLTAIRNGHSDIVTELVQYESVQRQISSHRNRALHFAVTHNQVESIDTLLLFPEVQAAIACADNQIYRTAVRNNQHEIISRLLRFLPVFHFAEEYEIQHGGLYVYYHICSTLAELERRKAKYEDTHHHGMFDVDEDEARILFYMLRYCIRRPRHDFQRLISTLLSIPKIGTMLHQEITPGQPNELLRIALHFGHREAVTALLNFPEVRRIAAENNYYNDNQEIDLRQMVQNRESAMAELTLSEQGQLYLIKNKYEPHIQSLGGYNNVFAQFKKELKQRYELDPAKVVIQGRELTLPLTYREFQQLHLTGDDETKALNAYFAHPVHTALRYLSIPNLWIHPEAEYVIVDPENARLRWADFEEYIPMICCMWVAASDASAIGPKEFSIANRQSLFISQFAMLGRAHNWDRSRPVIVGPRQEGQPPQYVRNANGAIVEEEYDDGELDKPSCLRGLKLRIFRALQDHPLFSPLTVENFDLEIRDMVRAYYKQAFLEHPNLNAIQKNINDLITEGAPLSPDVIVLNIPEEKISEFVQSLQTKYGEAFNATFELFVKETFNFEKTPSHILNFYSMYNIADVLTETIRQNSPPPSPSKAAIGHTSLARSPSSNAVAAPGPIQRSISQTTATNPSSPLAPAPTHTVTIQRTPSSCSAEGSARFFRHRHPSSTSISSGHSPTPI